MCETDEGTSLKREGAEADVFSTVDSLVHRLKILIKKIPKMEAKKFLRNLFY
jgi:hypothetical protein